MSDPMERVFNYVALGVVGVVVMAYAISPASDPVVKPPPEKEPFVVAIEAAPPAPAPPPVAKPPPPPPAVPKPLPLPKAPPPLPVPLPTPALAPVPPPPPVPVAPVVPVREPTPTPPVQAPSPPVPAPPPVDFAKVENGYVGRLRSYIRSITEYPTSGDARRLRPEGSTIVRFVLSRVGQISGVEVDKTSGSPILDRKAVSIVREGKYPAMPADAWPEKSDHTFTVTVEFVSP